MRSWASAAVGFLSVVALLVTYSLSKHEFAYSAHATLVNDSLGHVDLQSHITTRIVSAPASALLPSPTDSTRETLTLIPTWTATVSVARSPSTSGWSPTGSRSASPTPTATREVVESHALDCLAPRTNGGAELVSEYNTYEDYLETVLELELRRRRQSLWLNGTEITEFVRHRVVDAGKVQAFRVHGPSSRRRVPAAFEQCYRDVVCRADRIDVKTDAKKAHGMFVASGPGIDNGTVARAGPGRVQSIRFDVKRSADGKPLWNLCGDTLVVRAVLRPPGTTDLGREAYFRSETPVASVRVNMIDWFNGTYTGTFRLPACFNSSEAGVWTVVMIHAFHRFNAFREFVAWSSDRELKVQFLREWVFLEYRVEHAGLAQPCSVGASDVDTPHPPPCRGPNDNGVWINGFWRPYSCRASNTSTLTTPRFNPFPGPQRARFNQCFEDRKLCVVVLGASLSGQFFEGLDAAGLRTLPGYDEGGVYPPGIPEHYWPNMTRNIRVFHGTDQPTVARSRKEDPNRPPAYMAGAVAELMDIYNRTLCVHDGGTLVLVANFGVHPAALNVDLGQFTVGLEAFFLMLRLYVPNLRIIWRRTTAVNEEEWPKWRMAQNMDQELNYTVEFEYQNSLTRTRADLFDLLAMRSVKHHGFPAVDLHSFTSTSPELSKPGDTRHYSEISTFIWADIFHTFMCETPETMRAMSDYPTLTWPLDDSPPPFYPPGDVFRD